jgi:hypothetical protein
MLRVCRCRRCLSRIADRSTKCKVHPIVSIYCRDGSRQVNQFGLREMLTSKVVDVVGYMALPDEIGNRFCPSQRGLLSRTKHVAGFPPDCNEVEDRLGVAAFFPFVDVKIQAKRTPVHLRGANIGEVLQMRFEAAGNGVAACLTEAALYLRGDRAKRNPVSHDVGPLLEDVLLRRDRPGRTSKADKLTIRQGRLNPLQ